MRINIFANSPWSSTGYGVETKLFVPRIKKLGYDLSITAYYGLQGGVADFNGVRVYPNGNHPYGQDIMGAAAQQDGADIIITVTDAWVIEPQGIPPHIKWYPWFPVDCEPIPPAVLNKVRMAKKGIAMTRGAQEFAKAAGLDTYYVPMGVDTGIFRPVEGSRERMKWPDKFIVGMVASNKTLRKAQLEQIAAFAALHKQHPDTLLYLHTSDGARGTDSANLVNYARRLGLTVDWMTHEPVKDGTDVLFVDQYAYMLGLPDSYMVDVYNSLDVLMSASMGEGFGIPIVEAQACGCPVIVGDWTSMGEVFGSGWKIPKSEAVTTYDPNFEAFRWTVSVEAVLDRLLKAYQMRGNQEYRKRARDFALQFDADKITEKYWKPVLADIEAHLKDSPTDKMLEHQIGVLR